MNEAQTRTVCLLIGKPGTEMRGDAGRTEAVVQNRLDDYVFAFDIVIDGERKVRDAHAVMSEVNGMDADELGERIESGVDVFYEMVKYPCAVGCKEVLGLGEVEFGKGRESHAFHVKARSDGPGGGLSHPSSRRRESCRRRRAVRGGRVHARAIPAARMRRKPIQGTTKGSPSTELSARHPSRRFPEFQRAYSIPPFEKTILAKPAGEGKGKFA